MAFSKPAQNVAHLGLFPGHKVADFGAGSGAHAFEAAAHLGTLGRLYAIDIQRDLLSRLSNLARERGIENIEIITGDLEEAYGSKLADESVHALIVANILFQLEGRDVLAREAARILKKGGKALVIDWRDSYNGMGPRAESLVRPEDARRLFENAGLSFEKNVHVGDHHFGFLMRR